LYFFIEKKHVFKKTSRFFLFTTLLTWFYFAL